MDTIFITGASSGIGKATTRLFQSRGWRVIATMRDTAKGADLRNLERVFILPVDVTQTKTIEDGVQKSLDLYGHIDVVVNNAGYGLAGPFEATTEEEITRQFQTNVLGLMNVTRAILPHFRQRKSGVIVNISSMGGRITFPLYSAYHGTKWAVEGFSEALSHELVEFNIRVKIIEPGTIKTDFYEALVIAKKQGLTVYDRYIQKIFSSTKKAGQNGASPELVAQEIYRAVLDGSGRLRYPVGGNGPLLLLLRRILPESWFIWGIRTFIGD